MGGRTNMINLDAKVLKVLEESSCFGIAYDSTAPECAMCDVKLNCKSKIEGANIPTPTAKPKVNKPAPKADKDDKPATKKKDSAVKKEATKKVATEKKAPAKKATASKPSGNAPDFKGVELPELIEIAKKEGVEWKEYGNDNITRMRLVMSLKKHFS